MTQLAILFMVFGVINLTLGIVANVSMGTSIIAVMPAVAWFGLSYMTYRAAQAEFHVKHLEAEWAKTFKELASKFNNIRDGFEDVIKDVRSIEGEINRIETLTKVDYLEDLKDRVGVCEMSLNLGSRERAN